MKQQIGSNASVRRQIDALLDEHTDAQVAHILNEQKVRTVAGDAFDTASVKWARYSAKIKSLKERLLEAGWLTVEQVSARLGLSRTSICKFRFQGKSQGRARNDHGQWLYWPPERTHTGPLKESNCVSSAGGYAV